METSNYSMEILDQYDIVFVLTMKLREASNPIDIENLRNELSDASFKLDNLKERYLKENKKKWKT